MKNVIAGAVVAIMAAGTATVLNAQSSFDKLRMTPSKVEGSKPAAQKIDAEYTAKIKESLQDPRITTDWSITCLHPTLCRHRSSFSAATSASRAS